MSLFFVCVSVAVVAAAVALDTSDIAIPTASFHVKQIAFKFNSLK